MRPFHSPRTDTAATRVVAAIMLAAFLGTAGCATQKVAGDGADAVKHRNWDAAVYYYLEALAKDPDNITYRMELIKARQNGAQEHFERGLTLRRMGNLISAREELRLAVQLDPTHQFAQQTLDKVEADLEVLSRPDGQHQLEELKKAAREAKVKPPVLDPTSKEPITLVFPQPKPVKEIYQAMAKAYGFNVLFDPKLKDDRIPIELNDVTAERALEIVMQAAGQFYKVLDAHSIIIADDTPQNRREYEDLVIKTFFLSNADVKDVDKLLRSLIEARRLSTNEQLNAITLRDTADKVAIAEKLIATNDKAKAEVLVDVELLEVNRGKLQDIGTQLSASSYTLGVDLDRVNEDRPGDGSLYLEDLDKIGHSSLFINVPSLLINLAKSSNEATALAQPKMRITEGEKGSLVIGDRIPIPVTSFNSANNVGSGIVPVTSFQYQDVGIKIDVEPRVHHNREITLKVTVEVSQVSGNVVQNNQSQPIIGTRTINTVIRLQDGETNMLVGLYKEDNKVDRTDIPGLGSIPLIGRLFRNEKADHKTTDLVLTLTPHILRFPDITEEDLAPMWVGTESNISYFGAASPRVASGRADQGPFDRPEDIERPVPPGDEDSSAKESPFHVRRSPARANREAPSPGEGRTGVDLVPGGGLKSLFPADDGGNGAAGEGDEDLLPLDPNAQPIRLNLEPSVVSLHPDQGTYVSLVTRGGSGAYRLPFGISFDPTRIAITSLELAPGITALDQRLDPEKGFLWLDLQVAEGQATSQSLGSIGITALNAGSAPLVFTIDGAVTGDGFRIPVAAGNGAVFVSIPQGIGGK